VDCSKNGRRKANVGDRRLDDVPDLVVVVSSAVPHLNRVSVGGLAISEIEALVLVGPGDTVIGGDRPLLVLIRIGAIPNLHVVAVGGDTVGDVQAFVTEGNESTAILSPRLPGGPVAILDSHSGTVRVGSGSQALAIGGTWMDDVSRRSGGFGRGGAVGRCGGRGWLASGGRGGAGSRGSGWLGTGGRGRRRRRRVMRGRRGVM